jgi:hypothetical protein
MKGKIGGACRMNGTKYGSRNSAVGIEARLRAGRSGVQISAGDIFSTRSSPAVGSTLSLLFTGCQGAMLPTHPLIASRLRVNGCISLLPLYANMAWSWTNLPFTSTTVGCVFFSLSKDNIDQLAYCSSVRRLVNP